MGRDPRIKNALDDARMVVLVVQVLLGFQFSVVMERRFDRLSPLVQHVHVAGLALLLAAFALAVAPATFHRLAEDGNDTPRAVPFTSVVVGLALLPFAAALGVSLFVVSDMVGTRWDAVEVGVSGLVCALAWWYGWPLLRRHPPSPPERDDRSASDVEAKIEHTLTEAHDPSRGAGVARFPVHVLLCRGTDHTRHGSSTSGASCWCRSPGSC
jgi:uncharacterized protein DUF6328